MVPMNGVQKAHEWHVGNEKNSIRQLVGPVRGSKRDKDSHMKERLLRIHV